MVTISVQLSGNGLVRVNEIAGLVQKRSSLLVVLGRRLGNELQKWFRARRRDPGSIASRNNFPISGFWAKVSSSISAPRVEGEDKVIVSVTDFRFAQKVFGGWIRPKKAKALAIPIAPEAAGLTPALFEAQTGMQLFVPKLHGSGLARVLATAIQTGGHTGIRPIFLLSSGINQKPDPKALPPNATLDSAITDEAESYYQREIGNS